jgi:hypothetical protein
MYLLPLQNMRALMDSRVYSASGPANTEYINFVE